MALTETETYGTVLPGFVTDLDGNLAVTSDDSQVQWREGFLRDLDGRLVVAEDTGIMQDGFLRTPGGALCVTTGSVTQRGTKIPGFPTDDDGLICVANDGSPERDIYPGFFFSSGKLAVTGLGPGPDPGDLIYTESFTTDDGGWTSDQPLARDTVSFKSSPASLKYTAPGTDGSAQSPTVDKTGFSTITAGTFWVKSSEPLGVNVQVAVVDPADPGTNFYGANGSADGTWAQLALSASGGLDISTWSSLIVALVVDGGVPVGTEIWLDDILVEGEA